MIKQKLKKIMAELLGTDEAKINTDTSMDNIEGWDSLAHLKLVAGLEKFFNIKFSEKELLRLRSMKRILDILKSKNIKEVKNEEDILKEIIAKIMNVDTKTIDEDFSIETTSAGDDFTSKVFFSEIKKEFHVQLTTEEIGTIKTYKDIKEVLKKHGVLDNE